MIFIMRQYTHLPLKKVNYLQKEGMVHPLFPTFPNHNSKKNHFQIIKKQEHSGQGEPSQDPLF